MPKQLDANGHEVAAIVGVLSSVLGMLEGGATHVGPASIPDYLALVGDTADGFPGVPGWGEKASSVVLGKYAHLESIPKIATEWGVAVRGAARLAAALEENRERALLFRRLATLRTDVPAFDDLDDL